MGQNVADTHLHLHGEGNTHNTPRCRLHWGSESIDEAYDMAGSVVLELAKHYSNADWADFKTEFQDWMSGTVTAAAWAERDAFAAAARRMWGTA